MQRTTLGRKKEALRSNNFKEHCIFSGYRFKLEGPYGEYKSPREGGEENTNMGRCLLISRQFLGYIAGLKSICGILRGLHTVYGVPPHIYARGPKKVFEKSMLFC